MWSVECAAKILGLVAGGHSEERCIKSMYGAAAAAPPGNRSGRDQYAARRRTPEPFRSLATPRPRPSPPELTPSETRTSDSPAYITHNARGHTKGDGDCRDQWHPGTQHS